MQNALAKIVCQPADTAAQVKPKGGKSVVNEKMNPVDRQDAYGKITGKAKYVDDLKFPGMLYVQTVRIPSPHARILNIDSSEALKLKGVVKVLTAKDVYGRNHLPSASLA